MPPLSQGTEQTLIYVENEKQGDTVLSGSLYGIGVKTHKTTPLVSFASTAIHDAQVSTDGQWVLFGSLVPGTPDVLAIELVRIDGQYLQTLYCGVGASIGQISWSIDQKHVVFTLMAGTSTMYEFSISQGGDVLPLVWGDISIMTWLDTTHLYIIDSTLVHQQNGLLKLDLIDTTKFRQQLQNIPTIITSATSDASFDTSLDGTKLYQSQNVNSVGTIRVLPAYGGSPTTLYNDTAGAIQQVRVVSSSAMLVILSSATLGHTGLYKMNLDGTGLTALFGKNVVLNSSSQYTWSNVSRDGTLYAVKTSELGSTAQTLTVGALDNTLSPSTYVQNDGTGEIEVVGWTTM
jgi:hypothetical protein